jgi:hypothetical protein
MLRSVIARVVQIVARMVSGLARAVLRASYPMREIVGIRVTCVHDDDRICEALFARFAEALGILEDHAAWQVTHMRRGVRHIFITDDHTSSFQRPGRVAYLNATDVAATSPVRTACTLVALLTYARFEGWVPGSMARHRARVLRSGMEQQIRFAATLPDGESVISELSAAWDTGWCARDDRARLYRSLEARRTPPWAVAALRSIYGDPTDL